MRGLILLLLLLCVSCAGMSGGNSDSAGPNPDGSPAPASALPALPQDGGHPSAARHTSLAVDVVVEGDQFYDKSAGAAVTGTDMQLTAGAQCAWALYQLPGIAAGYAPQQLTIDKAGAGGSYWVALGNYAKGYWQFIPQEYSGQAVIPVASWADYASPGGNFYFAVVVISGAVQHNRATIRVDATGPLPAPTGLTAAPGDSSAHLQWDPYIDPRATQIEFFVGQQLDMSDAVLWDAQGLPGANDYDVLGLTNGTTYYIALKAFDGTVESAYSNIVSCVPAVNDFSVSGIWGRYGGFPDSGGCTQLLGPRNFGDVSSADLTDDRGAEANHTSPVINSKGRVIALSRDGLISSYEADLSARNWRFDYAVWSESGKSFVCPPQAPCCDNHGVTWYVLAEKGSRGAPGYVVGVASDGDFYAQYDLGALDDDNTIPYSSLNISPGNVLLCFDTNNQIPAGLDSNGSKVWRRDDFADQLEFHADAAVADDGGFCLPAQFIGIGIDQYLHWLTLHPGDGSSESKYLNFGSRTNYFGGVCLPGGWHIYPEDNQLLFLEASSGNNLGSVALGQSNLASSPARNVRGNFVFQLVAPGQAPGSMCQLAGVSVSPGDFAPPLNLEFSLDLSNQQVSSKPAVDGNDAIFFTDDGGNVYRVAFDPDAPIVDGVNPSITENRPLDAADTYHMNSFALGNGVGYLISEQNKLYRIAGS